MNRNHLEFILRRLHSLTGIVPLGAFLLEHFFTNSFSHHGAAAYNEKVEFLRTLPYLVVLEWGFIFGPFLYHTLYGLVIIFRGEVNVQHYPYGRNWMYFLQRFSSFFVLGFVLTHVFETRFGLWSGTLNGTPFGQEPDFYEIMSRLFNNPVIVAWYVVGILSTCFHFANGLSTFCMSWGITIGRRGQRLVGYACVAIGVGMAAMALWSMVGFKAHGSLEEYRNRMKARERAALVIEGQMSNVKGPMSKTHYFMESLH